VTLAGNSNAQGFGPRISVVFSGTGATTRLQNTILTHDPTATTTQDCGGTVISLGNNLIGDPTGCDITLQRTDLTGDAGLGAFADNGSPGNGHFLLLPTSRAIDAGNDTACAPTDQVGQSRIGHCDIGSIEFRPPVIKVMIEIKPGDDPPSINPRS